MKALKLWVIIVSFVLLAAAVIIFGQLQPDPGLRTWTAPGNDSIGAGTADPAAGYIVKYYPRPITALNWDSATTVPNTLTPKIPGQKETLLIRDLPQGYYYFAVRAFDSTGNIAEMSNVVEKKVDRIPPGRIIDLK